MVNHISFSHMYCVCAALMPFYAHAYDDDDDEQYDFLKYYNKKL
jgi:hypothetical protein